ncbi:hypothetical protein CN424_08510 [Bacillus cereus]|nr:hypothetical protein CN424_08510 [Bacillus cereus]
MKFLHQNPRWRPVEEAKSRKEPLLILQGARDYQLGIWFAGWKTQKADGAMITYKKDDRVVVLVLGGNAIYIYEEGKTQ